MKEIWGCDSPTQFAVWHDGDNKYHSCPLLFLSRAAVEWYNEYAYNIEHAGASPLYREQSSRYLAALKYYKFKLDEYEARARNKES